MNNNEKITRVKTLLGDNSISDEKIAVCLDLAKDAILNRLYQLFDDRPEDADIPTKYEGKQCELAVAMLGQIANGTFGVASHSEAAMGTSISDTYVGASSYGSSQWATYLVDITPYARTYSRR